MHIPFTLTIMSFVHVFPSESTALHLKVAPFKSTPPRFAITSIVMLFAISVVTTGAAKPPTSSCHSIEAATIPDTVHVMS